MNKDEIQETKALIKLKCIKNLINILHTLNMVDSDEDAKQYNIYLDYMNEHDFTTFKVNIDAGVNNNYNTVFKFNFKLKDSTTGFAIFKIIREYFVKKNDLQYSGFQYDGTKYSSHHIKTNHRVDLYSMIHSKKDLEKLKKFNDKIYEQYELFSKKLHETIHDKDKIQLLKANEKGNIVMSVISMLNELLNLGSNDEQNYDILLDYTKIDSHYKFNVKILKNGQQMPFKINFKLKNKEKGLEIFNKIIEHYIDNTLIMYDGYSSELNPDKTNYIIKSRNRINFNYKMSSSDSEKIIPNFKNRIATNENSKKLKKAK